jgi:site-specific DNA-methyltransferase (adenine-specific)/site-specific DNA-methyltransferase (cytosine-N4-specific)
MVLDPFMGSGTTILVADRMNRRSVGIEIKPEYYEMVKEALNSPQLYLLEPKVKYGNFEPEGRRKVR